MIRMLIAALALSLCLVAPWRAAAQDETLLDALMAIDAPSLSAWSERADAAPGEAALARAAMAALRREDAAAAEQLAASAADASLPADLRRAAWLSLFTVHLRQGRYGDAVAAMDAADALGSEPDPARAASNAQARALVAILSDVPPMKRAGPLSAGELPLQRDLYGLRRVEARINDVSERAVVDTGASTSAISESLAERAGLRILGEATSATSSISDLQYRVAIADRLVLGDMAFENVVFAVMPDSALTFAGGSYTIGAIVGVPVLIELGRLEFRRESGAELLRYGPSPESASEDANLLLNGLNPLVLISAAGADAPLVMTLDTGANVTSLTPLAAEDHPELVRGAREVAGTRVGAGGAVAVDARIIARLELSIAGFEVTLRDVTVAPFARDLRHGVIGQDVLGSGAGYVLDFQALRFEILPPG